MCNACIHVPNIYTVRPFEYKPDGRYHPCRLALLHGRVLGLRIVLRGGEVDPLSVDAEAGVHGAVLVQPPVGPNETQVRPAAAANDLSSHLDPLAVASLDAVGNGVEEGGVSVPRVKLERRVEHGCPAAPAAVNADTRLVVQFARVRLLRPCKS
eukprot:CAMPEP_0173419192 /NCGR_PEP_ID=MMETSP1357-20121228/1126_1 /TAXON_ID=77926 /ORGANISM="Hemiselmis rufescens, Strain PCC563" /LENGTH=153 /DNA_ID=CAMNT_0014381795 /DNA_START=94 /DNA_END=555 /DNA_ORIENTATION=+